MKKILRVLAFIILGLGIEKISGAAVGLVEMPAAIRINNHELIFHGTLPSYDVALYKELILYRPQDLLVSNVKADLDFYNAFPDDSKTLNRLYKKLGFKSENVYRKMVAYTCKEAPSYIRKQTNYNPLWALNECVRNQCRLSRLESNARDMFEHAVTKAALEQYQQEKTIHHAEATLQYVDVGSGELFQTLRSLTLLLESGISRINVHLIEPFFETYLKRKQSTQKECERRLMQEETGFLLKEERFAQLAHWFKQAYPDSTVRIFIYDSLDDYTAHTQHNSAMLANIYIGSDLDFSFGSSTIQGEMEQKKSGFKETRYMEQFDEYVTWQPAGLLSYVCIPHEKVLKPYGVGMLLYKGSVPGAPGLQHCIKLLPKDMRPDDAHTLIVDPVKVPTQTRCMVLVKTYDSSPGLIRSKL